LIHAAYMAFQKFRVSSFVRIIIPRIRLMCDVFGIQVSSPQKQFPMEVFLITHWKCVMHVLMTLIQIIFCYLKKDTKLPWTYMDDAIEGTIKLMETDKNRLSVVTYNMTGLSFTPEELFKEIKKMVPSFNVSFEEGDGDVRQRIADSVPEELDDKKARHDWEWNPKYSLPLLTQTMLKLIQQQKKK